MENATNVTLNGSATDIWIFQIAQDLTVASATNVLLGGGALAKNVIWQVSGHVELGTNRVEVLSRRCAHLLEGERCRRQVERNEQTDQAHGVGPPIPGRPSIKPGRPMRKAPAKST